VSYCAGMRLLPLPILAAAFVGIGALAIEACSSDGTGATPATDAGGEKEEHERVIACPPADGGAAAAEAGVVAKIASPTNGQKFTTTDRITFRGTGSAPDETSITDKTRMIWYIVDEVKGVDPEGEGPEDTAGPYPAGTYQLRFDVSNKACVTAADQVTFTVE
jgi:hypothetical protein